MMTLKRRGDKQKERKIRDERKKRRGKTDIEEKK